MNEKSVTVTQPPCGTGTRRLNVMPRWLLLSMKSTLATGLVTIALFGNAAVASVWSFDVSCCMSGNGLGLAVNSADGSMFLTNIAIGGGDNFFKFSPEGTLQSRTRVNLGYGLPPWEHFITFGVHVPGDALYFYGLAGRGNTRLARISEQGILLGTSPANLDVSRFTYLNDAVTFWGIADVDRQNPRLLEFTYQGTEIDSVPIRDPYLSLFGGHVSGLTFSPISKSLYATYLNQTGHPVYDNLMAEYRLRSDGAYHVEALYDLKSIGVMREVLAMDLNRVTGTFFVQEGNQRVVAFALTDVSALPIPEPATGALLLSGVTALSLLRVGSRRARV